MEVNNTGFIPDIEWSKYQEYQKKQKEREEKQELIDQEKLSDIDKKHKKEQIRIDGILEDISSIFR